MKEKVGLWAHQYSRKKKQEIALKLTWAAVNNFGLKWNEMFEGLKN